MLVYFSASNFLSFKEPFTFSTRATRERQHSHRIFQHEPSGLRLVPISAIFGGNGSGKSNFYRALQLVRRLVLQMPRSADELIPAEPFRLDDDLSEEQPSRFIIEIMPGDTVYRLTIAITRKAIVEERLEEIRHDRPTVLYARVQTRSTVEWDTDEFQHRLPETDRAFVVFKTRDTLPNQLFLTVLRGKNLPVVDEISTWFAEQLGLMLPEATFRRLEFNLPTTRGLLDFCNETLRSSDTGIHDLNFEMISWRDFEAPPDFKEEIERTLGDHQLTFVLSPDGRRFSVTRHNGEFHVARIFTQHRTPSGKLVRFEISSESEGVQRLIDLLPAFFELLRPRRPKVFIIDELDRSLHTQLTRHLVKSYLQAMGPSARSQLIFTTHDITLLDQDLLRRDEVWFVEKKFGGASSLRSLSAFSGLRYDRDIQRAYLAGDFSGLPLITAPAFRTLRSRLPLAAPVPPAPDPVLSEFENSFPANRADRLLCALVLDFIDVRGSLDSTDLLDALILATHPELCRTLAPEKPSRKTENLFAAIQPEVESIRMQGLRWQECMRYLEQHRRAIRIRTDLAGRPITAGEEFSRERGMAPSGYLAIALFALSVLDGLKSFRLSRGPTAEISIATNSLEILRAKFQTT